MKSKGIVLLVITTILLVMLTIMAALDFQYAWIFSLTTIGQIVLVFAVYHVLTDNYHTDKEFKDWYEDKPIDSEANMR
jgi:ABC-type transport system involved in Fe-S cluster assembly fused permease/ATPase subunit